MPRVVDIKSYRGGCRVVQVSEARRCSCWAGAAERRGKRWAKLIKYPLPLLPGRLRRFPHCTTIPMFHRTARKLSLGEPTRPWWFLLLATRPITSRRIANVVLFYPAWSSHQWHREFEIDTNATKFFLRFICFKPFFSFVEGAGVQFWYALYDPTYCCIFLLVNTLIRSSATLQVRCKWFLLPR